MRIHLRHGLPLTHRTIHRTMRLTRLRLTRKARKRPLLAGRSRHTQRTQLKRPRFDRSAPSQRKNDGGNAEDWNCSAADRNAGNSAGAEVWAG